MLSIRKFVGWIKVAAALTSVLVVGLGAQTASAGSVAIDSAAAAPIASETHPTVTLSPACAAAIQNIKTAFAADRSEDTAERAQATLEPESAADQAEDAAELANFKALFGAA